MNRRKMWSSEHLVKMVWYIAVSGWSIVHRTVYFLTLYLKFENNYKDDLAIDKINIKIWTYSKESLLFSLSTVMFYLNVSSCTVVLWKRFYTSMVVMVMLKHFFVRRDHFINFDSLYQLWFTLLNLNTV